MLPAAAIVHRAPGRVRLRIEERRRDDAYFAHVAQQLRQCPSVVEVIVTPLTGSVLVRHEGTDIEVIAGYGKAFELFEVGVPARHPDHAEPLPDQVIRERLDRIDRWMRRESGDHADARSMALLGLLAAAVWQLARGNVLPAGGTLLWYALALTRQGQPRPGESQADVVDTSSISGQADGERPHHQ
jgi:hypothetical protein